MSEHESTIAFRGIVVGIDGSQASKAALAWAVEEARVRGTSVLAVQAWQFPAVAFAGYGTAAVPMLSSEDVEQVAAETLATTVADVVGDDVSVPVETSVRNGHAARVLVDVSKDAALLVVGSEGHGAFAGMLLGSTSLHAVHHATCPVVVVRPDWKPAA